MCELAGLKVSGHILSSLSFVDFKITMHTKEKISIKKGLMGHFTILLHLGGSAGPAGVKK
jgi:hypothetical protein